MQSQQQSKRPKRQTAYQKRLVELSERLAEADRRVQENPTKENQVRYTIALNAYLIHYEKG